MSASFKILVPNLAYRYVYRFVLFLGILNTAIFGFMGYKQNSKLCYIYCLTTLVATIVVAIIQNLNKQLRFKRIFYSIVYVSISVAWIILGVYWLGILIVILSFIEGSMHPTYYWVFKESHIHTIGYFPTKKVEWHSLQQVILKDGLLKFDYKNNKLIYFNQLATTEATFTEEVFNEFCNKQIQ